MFWGNKLYCGGKEGKISNKYLLLNAHLAGFPRIIPNGNFYLGRLVRKVGIGRGSMKHDVVIISSNNIQISIIIVIIITTIMTVNVIRWDKQTLAESQGNLLP